MHPSMVFLDYFNRAPWHTRHEGPARDGLGLHHALLLGTAFLVAYVGVRIAQWLWRPHAYDFDDELPKYYNVQAPSVDASSWSEFLWPLLWVDRVYWTRDVRRAKYRRRHKTSSIALDTIPEETEKTTFNEYTVLRMPSALKLS
ncbi:hypothetical protein SPRG_17596 [Saprolegnia parasitica CBS 223.65]|uniref:Uncharacterized protein n=1 Tax=Saprolegnia parasitica (strain CBS 223.65) TaxID=695850 RepID=A0A067BQI3_SAPPC|nr:hypothetical protein SPRG_17596 [Saprolegnia parasitica CBS 223.65]KDO16947.1 hypothetical protein SPRG_17596 [Saprolegnia parasitica CBS 223.65]|eukprot:XP_012212345.1 hypothetical protein SPRG_17596 [Saprolegnia parasitica CBS 223.65]